MKKKKILVAATSIIMLASMANGVKAVTWGGDTSIGSTVNYTRSVTGITLRINYGEVDGNGNLIKNINIPLSRTEDEDGTVKAGCPANHYTMSLDNADSNGIVTGLDTTTTQNNGEKLIVNALKTGRQTIHIITRNTSNDWPAGVDAYDNTVTVIASYSTNFQNAASALGITFNGDNTVYYSDNMNVYPENIDKFEAILNAKSKYDALNQYEKQRLDSIIATESNGAYSNYTALYNAADSYLTNLARTFITSTSVQGLQGNTVANKTNYDTIIKAETEYNGLKSIVKNRVNLILTNEPSAQYGGYSSVNYPTLLINAKAYKFIDTYSIDTPDINLSKIKDEKILDSEINTNYKWNDLDADVKSTVNAILTSEVGRDYASQMNYVRNHLEQTLADSFVDNTFFTDYEELAGTKSLRNYNKNTEMNEDATGIFENLARKITGTVDTEYNSIISNKYVNVESLNGKINNEIANSDYPTILEAATDYINDLEAARNFVEEHKLNDELTAEIAEDVITLGNAIQDQREKAMVEYLINKTMEEKIDEADDFLTELATKFVNDNNLNADFYTLEDKEDLDNKEAIANKIIELADEFENLTPTVKARVLAQIDREAFEEKIEEANEFLDDVKSAKNFVSEHKLNDELTVEIAEDILTLDNAVEGRVEEIVELLIDKTMNEKIEEAEEFLNKVAEEFIEENQLNEELTKSIANNIVNNLEDNYNNLSSEIVKQLVDEKLEKTIDEIIEEAKDFLDRTAAEEFYDNYLDGLDEEKIVAGEDTWNNSSEKVQELINALLEDNDVDSTYPELLTKARETLNNKAAEEFINNYLTQDNGEVIGKVDGTNYKKVIKAADPYEALSEEVKEIVNNKLKASVNTTYPELLAAAQDMEKTPKTGDMSAIMIAVLVISVVGIIVILRKRK